MRCRCLISCYKVLGSAAIVRFCAIMSRDVLPCLISCYKVREVLLLFDFVLWGGSKGVINFQWIFFLCNSKFSPCWALPDISRHLFTWLVCGSFQWRHGLLFTDCIVWDDKDKVIGFKRSLWIHLGWWSTGSPKLQLFQISQHSHVTNRRLISSSA